METATLHVTEKNLEATVEQGIASIDELITKTKSLDRTEVRRKPDEAELARPRATNAGAA